MTADTLASGVAKSLEAMVLNIQNGLVFVFHMEGLQQPVLFQC